MQEHYERSGRAVDAEIRAAMPPPPHKDALDDDQLAHAEACEVLHASFGPGVGRSQSAAGRILSNASRQLQGLINYVDSDRLKEWTKVQSPSPFVSMFTKRVVEQSRVMAKAEGVVDCPAREVVAWWVNACSRESMDASRDLEHDPAKFVLSERSQYDNVLVNVKAMPWSL
jgi:hypothetical protein